MRHQSYVWYIILCRGVSLIGFHNSDGSEERFRPLCGVPFHHLFGHEH